MATKIFFWINEKNERLSELLEMARTLINKYLKKKYQPLKISHTNLQNNWKWKDACPLDKSIYD